MSKNEVILRFEEVDFAYEPNKPILEEVSFSVRRNSKITVMGQNGGGKSTIFSLITGELKPEEGRVLLDPGVTVAIGRQVIVRDELDLSVRDFFLKSLTQQSSAGKTKKNKGKSEKAKPLFDIDRQIDSVLEVVNLQGHQQVHDRLMRSFSGGQQARLLLASALIQDPDLLLLDEPTNNLDRSGIEHLTDYLKNYPKTVIVISHDADFLNSFTDGVLYLDVKTHKVGQYVGNYFDVVAEIAGLVEKERRQNAQLSKKIQDNKDKANFFANKGGRMRLLARRMRDKAQELEESKVDARRDDKTIRFFKIPCQPDLLGDILTIKEFSVVNPKTHKLIQRKADLRLRKKQHLLLTGPNGIGKSSLLESVVNGGVSGIEVDSDVIVGYYRQDFSNLNFEKTVYSTLIEAMTEPNEEKMRSVAAGFLITAEEIKSKIGSLSEGQKGLVAFARLVLLRPGLLILDEPTNHINFRHIPVIAEALNDFEGAMVLVSHVPEFVSDIRIDEILDLEK